MWYEMKWEILLQVGWGPLKGMKHMTWLRAPSWLLCGERTREDAGRGGHLGSCKTVLSTASLCNGKDGEKWTGLRYILKVESRVTDGLVGRESEKLRRTPRFSVHVSEGGWWCRFPR